MAQYTYTISVDFPNNAVAPDVLTTEIEESSISTGVLEGVTARTPDTDTCYLDFDTSLSGGDVTTLDGLVAAHQGVPFLMAADGSGWNLTVEDQHLTAPPGSPVTGLYYIVATPSTGAWAGHENCIASWNGTTWQYQRPGDGFAVWVADEDLVVVWDGTSWGEYGTGTGGTAIFGSNLHLAESTAVSTTTSNSWQTKITMVTATLEAGTYRLEVSYGWNHDVATDDFWGRVTQDAVQIGEAHLQEPKDATGDWGSTGTDQRHYLTRVFHLNLSAQSYTFDLEYGSSWAGTESSIWDAYLSLWRMS